MPEAKSVSKMGRPTLDETQQAEVFARLSMHPAKSPEYRQARQDLAVKMKRTERAIDLMFDRLKKQFVEAHAAKPKGKGRAA